MKKQFGDRLKELRLELGLTQEQLAQKFNTGKASISHYESNKRLPDASTIEKFADFFEVSVDYLLGRKDTYSSEELLKHIPKEYKKSFEKLNLEQLKFVKKMADEDIDPNLLIDTMNKINEYYEKLNKKKHNK
ncbi:helix-turn-helix domain-containing protein [Maledivibacter halophilus]|uniref:Predicted transcription factor, homolog of eukaryotic MBF1 n=1 Tax=Maledivibacter halophilus TaxID=36842 RepID=A0A1T5KDC9_9FIRM|nr:helix-turn-helix transcriptional regulator [Maledivibacter halophilus]SKC61706.1 Predicted transcription factor, homolog of eukaryotic MBF1 [Maledivibacter halophilus]